MIGNVQILNNNESLIVNGIAHFMVNETSRQYVAYWLGEETGDAIKIYIGLENVQESEPGISKEESESLNNILRSIGKSEDVSTILTFLPLSAQLYHINGEVKKIVVPLKVVNNMIFLQQQSQIKKVNEDTSIISENSTVDNNAQNNKADENITNVVVQNEDAPVLQTTDGLVTDEQAKEAIKLVEEAQKSIEENVRLIKLYINQQKELKSQIAPSADEIVVNPQKGDVISENSSLGNEDNALSKEPDAVDSINLTPEYNEPVNVFGEQSELKNDGIDVSTHMDSSINMGSTIDTGVAISADSGNNEPVTNEKNVEFPVIDNAQNQENVMMNQQENGVEFIDTISMIPNQVNNVVEQNNNGQSQYIDTGLPVNETNGSAQYIDAQNSINNDVSAMDSVQPVTSMIDTPYSVTGEIDNSNIGVVDNETNNLQGNPVIIPDGQSSEINQELVLTPEAFKIAA